MPAKTKERLAKGLFFALFILILAACNAVGNTEPSVANIAADSELAEASTANGESTASETGSASEIGLEDTTDKAVTRENETEAGGVDGEQAVKSGTVEAESTTEPAEVIEPTASPQIPTATAEPQVEKDGLPRDDRPEYLRLATSGWNTNWEKHSIDYEEFLSGGPPRDGIRSIDDPDFVAIEEAGV